MTTHNIDGTGRMQRGVVSQREIQIDPGLYSTLTRSMYAAMPLDGTDDARNQREQEFGRGSADGLSFMDRAAQAWEIEDVTSRFPIEHIAYFDRTRPEGQTVRAYLNAVGMYVRGYLHDLGNIVTIYTAGKRILDRILDGSIGTVSVEHLIAERNRQTSKRTIGTYDRTAYDALLQKGHALTPEALNKHNFLYMAMVLAHRVLFQNQRWDL